MYEMRLVLKSRYQLRKSDAYADRLRAAGISNDLMRDDQYDSAVWRPQVEAILAEIADDPSVDTAAVRAIAEELDVIRVSGRSKTSLIDNILSHYIWLLYQRDANAMARRATPW